MYNSLELLVIAFVIMCVVSVLALLFLFLFKSEKKQKVAFYFLAVWGMIITYCNVRMLPMTGAYTGEVVLALALGVLSVIALLLQLIGKNEKKFTIAKILVSVSVIAGMIDAFLF